MVSRQSHHRKQAKPHAKHQVAKPTSQSQAPVLRQADTNLLQRAATAPSSLSPQDVQRLGGTYGNRAVLGILGQTGQPEVQARLTVSAAGTVQRLWNPFKRKKKRDQVSAPKGFKKTTTASQLMQLLETADEKTLRAMSKNRAFLNQLEGTLSQEQYNRAYEILNLGQTRGTLTLPSGAKVEKKANPTISLQGWIPPSAQTYDDTPSLNPAGSYVERTYKTFDTRVKDQGEWWLRFVDGGQGYWVKESDVELPGHVEATGSLFPHTPTLEDVQQGGIGDCYLMAAVASMVNKDPETLKGMMRDNRDGTVTVRLYDINQKGTKKSFGAKYIQIDKSVAKLSGEELYAKGALWVKMLEKAYTAAGYTGSYTVPGSVGYANINLGFMTVALEHLVGKEAKIVEWTSSSAGTLPALPSKVTEKEWNKIKAGAEQIAQKGATTGDYKAELRLEDFQRYFQGAGLKRHPFSVRQAVLKWIEGNRIYPGKRGTGKYTEKQMDLFQKIKTAVDAGKYIGMGSFSKIARQITGSGASAGEPTAKGLVGAHYYTVLGYGYGTGKTKESTGQPNEIVWVKVRNPWGKYGRQYEWDDGKLKVKKAYKDKGKTTTDVKSTEALHETPGGIFWLELSDVTKRLGSIETL